MRDAGGHLSGTAFSKRVQGLVLKSAKETLRDPFAAVLGTTRGSDRAELTPEPDAAACAARLQRIVEANGDVRYYNYEDQLHRETGPAVERADGGREWWQDGQRHRETEPAVELADGRREWHQDGHLHRIDGPAIELPDGERQWYSRGRRHRIDGPATELPDGTRLWFHLGKRHRIDGPTVP